MYKEHIKIKEKLAFRLVRHLNNLDWEEINDEILFQGINEEKKLRFKWLVNDKVELLKIYFELINLKILYEAENDFLDDKDATIREKLIEIILRKCEHHQKDKIALRKVRSLIFNYSEISIKYLSNFMFLSKQALLLSGDDLRGYRGKLREIGVCGVFGIVFENWLMNNLDESKVLSLANKYIARAEEYALFFNIIYQND